MIISLQRNVLLYFYNYLIENVLFILYLSTLILIFTIHIAFRPNIVECFL